MNKRGNILTIFSHKIIVATGILIFTLIYFWDVSSLNNSQDKLLVDPVIWIIILLYPIIIWQEWREKNNKTTEKVGITEQLLDDADLTDQLENEEEEDEASARLTKKIFYFMLSTLLYLLIMNYLGFVITTIIYMPIIMWILGTKSKKTLILLPIGFTVLLYILFSNLLGIPLPQGLLLQGVL